jgi:hypothetical protein
MTTLNSLSAATISTPTVTALLRALPEIQAEAGASGSNLSYAELDERMRHTLAKILNLVHWLNAGGHQDASHVVDTPLPAAAAVEVTNEAAEVLSNEAINLNDAKISMLRFTEGNGHDTYNFSGDMKSSTIILEGKLTVNDVLHIRSKKLINVSFLGGRDSITIDYSNAKFPPAGAFINIITRPDDQRSSINLKL